MDYKKVGKLIASLRKEKQLTQKSLADMLHLSDRTVSKWERGAGFPDVTLLSGISQILDVNIASILAGDLDANDRNGGNVNKIKFYVCPTCGNVLTGISEADIACCGRKLNALTLKTESNEVSSVDLLSEHEIRVEVVEDEYYVTLNHDMSKSHYISFVAYSDYKSVMLVKLYPEQNAELRLPQRYGRRIYAYCTEHGLFEQTINIPDVIQP